MDHFCLLFYCLSLNANRSCIVRLFLHLFHGWFHLWFCRVTWIYLWVPFNAWFGPLWITERYIYNTIFFCFFAERRQAEAARIREKYPDRIPVLKDYLCCMCKIESFWMQDVSFLHFLDVLVLYCRSLWRRLKKVIFLTLTRKSWSLPSFVSLCLLLFIWY